MPKKKSNYETSVSFLFCCFILASKQEIKVLVSNTTTRIILQSPESIAAAPTVY